MIFKGDWYLAYSLSKVILMSQILHISIPSGLGLVLHDITLTNLPVFLKAHLDNLDQCQYSAKSDVH